jgi:hypothetical protein
MAERHESEGKRSEPWGALGALDSPSRWDPSLGFADSGLLGRLAEEMYGELAFARAASSHPRSTLAREITGTFSPSTDSRPAGEAPPSNARAGSEYFGEGRA